jgi:hypothetical protein
MTTLAKPSCLGKNYPIILCAVHCGQEVEDMMPKIYKDRRDLLSKWIF